MPGGADFPFEIGNTPSCGRAARAGHTLLNHLLPPWWSGSVHAALASARSGPGGLALAGSLLAIPTSLEREYRIAGSRVRDHLMSLHAMILRPDETPAAAAKPREPLAEFAPWIRAVCAADNPGSARARKILFQWTELSGERLTMKAYPRREHFERHARALVGAPVEALLGMAENTFPPAAAEAALLLFDLVRAAEDSAIGRNRINIARTDGFGGFYGLSDEVKPPTPDEIEAALLRAKETFDAAHTISFPDGSRAEEIFGRFRSSAADLIARRIQDGRWNAEADFTRVPAAEDGLYGRFSRWVAGRALR